ncbi:pantetheine-phosphate adenylyltransferase [Williamsia deligens]|uniref:Phosphopantetheine adenylyltransferase n=1 Tax=Williamsia deligens TaxID=321325 RepID=A0ABW3GCE8_9NOCA|nr:pantetheine-phosphate adenylyltransferase [Williamsia deligens]MCP2195568.1 Phosphopantetheine adenylyltransferase [Williamsia deligens]
MTTAVCPGSFDPITSGHLFVVERCVDRFDDVVVLVTVNPSKRGMFDIDDRVALIEASTAHLPNVRVDRWEGLLVDYLRGQPAPTLVKGLRSVVDFQYESPMAQMNRELADVETLFLLGDPRHAHVSSSLVKEIARLGGDISPYVPAPVASAIAAAAR